MRAMVIDEYGGPEKLYAAEIPDPQPGPGEVRVKLAYAAVNPAECKFREGWGERFPSFRAQFPFILGLEGVGLVDKIGEDVADPLIGKQVVMRCDQRAGASGSYAQYAVAPQTAVALLPDGMDMADAATVPVAGVTAYQALVHAAAVSPGQTVLVHGAAGGVGGFAVQFAKALGALVAATCSARNMSYVADLGADHLIDYATPIAAGLRHWVPEGVDVIIDCVGLHSLPDALALLRPGGIDVRIATLSDSDHESPTTDEAADRGLRAEVKLVDRTTAQADMVAILDMMAAGIVKPPAVEVVPLEQVTEAHRRLEERKVRGKLLLRIS